MKVLSILISVILYHETLGCSSNCPVAKMIPLETPTSVGFGTFSFGGKMVFSDSFNENGTIYSHDTECGCTNDAVVPDSGFISAIIPLGCKKDQYIIAAGPELKTIKWDEKSKTACTGKTIFNVNQNGSPDNFRISTVKTDPEGKRAYFTSFGKKLCGIKGYNPLYSYSKREGVRIHLRGFKLINAYAWNGKKMYALDPCTRSIYSFDWCPITGDLSNKEFVICLEMGSDAWPAGLVSDLKGNLYTAIYGEGKVLKIDPCEKRIVDTMEVDAKYISSLSIAGPDMSDLYVTSSTLAVCSDTGKPPEKQPHNPNGGCLIQIKNFASKGRRDKKLCH